LPRELFNKPLAEHEGLEFCGGNMAAKSKR